MRPGSRAAVPERRRVGLVTLLLGTLFGLAAPAAGQEGGAPWPAVSAGARFGYDQAARGTVVGTQIRIPVLRSGRVELVPNGDVTFLRGLREYGFNADAVYVTGGRQGGVYLGGGFALRSSVFGSGSAGRETEPGYGLVVGAKAGGPARFGTQIEFRWIFLPGVDYEPRAITVGVNFPLWGGGGRSGG